MNSTKQIPQTQMTIARFSQLVAAYGSKIPHWPSAEQAAAKQLLETSSEAYRMQQAAVRLDNLLDRVLISPPSPQLRNRIIKAIPLNTPSPSFDTWQWLTQLLMGTTFHEHVWRPAVTLLVPLLLGMIIGFNLASLPENGTAEVEETLSFLGLGTLEQQL